MAIVTALICIVFLLVGTHSFMVWLSRSWQADQSGVTPWRRSWTVSLVALVLLAFVAGTAVVGAAHQVAWLSASSESWIKSERRYPMTFANRYAYEIRDLRKAGKPLPAEVLQRMRSETAAAEQRVVVLSDQTGLPWFVAVGPHDPANPGWKRSSFVSCIGDPKEEKMVQGGFTGDQWAELLADAAAGRSLERFRR